MKLNRNSKWIKWYLKFNDYRPTNFCDYFWGSVKTVLISITGSIVGLFFIGCLLSPIALLWSNYDDKSDLSIFQFIGIGLWLSAVIVFLIHKIIEYNFNKPYKPKQDSVIKIWYKDFKNKHCTLITWKD